MTLGCCCSWKQWAQVAAADFQTITLPGVELVAADDMEFETLRQTLSASPLAVRSINSFCPPELRLTGKDLDLRALEEYARRLFPRAAALGAEYIGIGGPKSRSVRPGETREEALEDLKRSLGTLCRIGEEYGLTILLESVCSLECNLVTYTYEAAQMVRELALPNLGLVYDIYHAFMMGEAAEYILQVADLVRVVHIAQDQEGKRIYLREEHMPEYLPYLQALHRAGYEGEVNLECFVGDVVRELPRSKKILDQLMAQAK